jgi:hypothetical protein
VRSNRTVFAIVGVMVVVLAIAGILGESKKKTPPKSFFAVGSYRAVVVPTDHPRTVVVTPCNAPATGVNVGTPGATTLRLQANSGMRTVVVPKCVATKGTQANGTANAASAAFVLKAGEQPKISSQVVVPSDSAARTIVVAPCTRQGAAREVLLTPRGDTAVAPAC